MGGKELKYQKGKVNMLEGIGHQEHFGRNQEGCLFRARERSKTNLRIILSIVNRYAPKYIPVNAYCQACTIRVPTRAVNKYHNCKK
jgi:hypothetical protein